MKYIYVAFLAPNNKMGKSIRLFTRNRYSHVAISLSDTLETMYSFARIRKRVPLAGGFVIEYPKQYFSSKGDVPLKLAKVALNDDKYERLVEILEDFNNRKESLIYNSLDALTSSFFKKTVHIKDSYTCISFCCYLLGLKRIFTIRELETKLDSFVVFIGNYKDYVKNNRYQDSVYFEDIGPLKIVSLTFSHFYHLLSRLFKKHI